MNINEMLIYADMEHINKIAEHYKCQCNRNSKTDTIQAILYYIFQKEMLEESIYQLNELEYTFVQLLYLNNRNQYSLEDLLAKGKQAIEICNNSIAKPRDLVLLALKKGWVFNGVGKKYLFVYLIPQDLKERIIKVIYNYTIKKLKTNDQVSFYRDERKLFIADLLALLKYVKDEQVLLTNEGNIYKRQQQSIMQNLHVKEELISKVSWRFGYGRRYNEYPDRFSLIYDFAYYNKLIYEDETGLLSITTNGEKHLVSNTHEIDNKIYKFWIRLYKYAIPHIIPIVSIIDLVSHNKWIELDSFDNIILFWLKDHFYEGKQQVFRERIIKMLMHIGVIFIGEEADKTFIKVTPEGHKWINEI